MAGAMEANRRTHQTNEGRCMRQPLSVSGYTMKEL